MRLVVIGTGIIGASIAWHLTRQGAAVTPIDRQAPGGVATAASWAWINASWGNPEPYVRLRMASMEAWRRLGDDLPELGVRWTGGLLWDLEPKLLDAYAEEHARWGYPLRVVDRAEAARIEPALANPPSRAVHVAAEGAVDPAHAARVLAREAEGQGAKLLRAEVEGIVTEGGRVSAVETSAGRLGADAVVVAAGEATPALLATAGARVPVRTPPGLLVVTKPAPPMLNGLVMAPELHARQDADGRIIAGADFGGSDPGDDAEGAALETFAALRRLLKDGDTLGYGHHTVGNRPTPADGFPVAGPVSGVPGLWVAVMHSGVTLAPAIGAMLAAEITGGPRDPLLAPYGHGRFADPVPSAM